jgi:hypothetical protein
MAVLNKVGLAALFAAIIARAIPIPPDPAVYGVATTINGESTYQKTLTIFMKIDNSHLKAFYTWEIDAAETERLSQLLGTDFSRFGLRATRLDGPKAHCDGCGKLSGFDDFVHNALADGIHSKEFIIKVVQSKNPHNPSPPHELRCMSCGISYKEKRGWTSAVGWADFIKDKVKRGWTSNVGWADFSKKRSEDSAAEDSEDIAKRGVAKRGWTNAVGWADFIKSRSDEDESVVKRGWTNAVGWADFIKSRSDEDESVVKRGWTQAVGWADFD